MDVPSEPADPRGGDPCPADRPRRRPAVVALAVVVVAVGAVIVLADDDVPPSDVAAVSTASTVDRSPDRSSAPEPGGAAVGLRGEPTESQLPWPDPPVDHEPHVVTSYGDGPLVDDGAGLALVYVNSIGRATFLDLATGDRSEIDVSSARVVDRIALEPRGFRSLVERRNVRLAGPGAIVVFLHQPTLLAGWSGEDEPGLHLCLTDVCAARGDRDRLVLDRQRISDIGMTVQRLDQSGRLDVTALVEGPATTHGRFRLVETPGGSARVPTPGAGPIWLIDATGATGRSAEV